MGENSQESETNNREDASDIVYSSENFLSRHSHAAVMGFWKIRKGQPSEADAIIYSGERTD